MCGRLMWAALRLNATGLDIARLTESATVWHADGNQTRWTCHNRIINGIEEICFGQTPKYESTAFH